MENREVSDSARLFPSDSTLFHLSRRESRRTDREIFLREIPEKGQFGCRSDAPLNAPAIRETLPGSESLIIATRYGRPM